MATIYINGCDDTTIITEKDWGMPFSMEELEIIGKLADVSSKVSSYGCQPTITIEEDN